MLQESPEGRRMMEFRRSLPAYKEKDNILSAISQNQVLRVCSDFSGWFIVCSETNYHHNAFCLACFLSFIVVLNIKIRGYEDNPSFDHKKGSTYFLLPLFCVLLDLCWA